MLVPNILEFTHFIRDNFGKGLVFTTHVPTVFQIPDIFSRRFPQGKFQDLVDKLQMIDIHLPT